MDRDRSVPKLLNNSRLILQQDNLTRRRFGKKVSADGILRPNIRRSSMRKRSMKMKAKVLLAIVALSYAPLVVAGDEAAYPKEKVAAIVVLDQKSSGIYLCVAEPGDNGGSAKTQTVILLKRKDANALLKGRESFREFTVCPVVGGSDSTSNSYGD